MTLRTAFATSTLAIAFLFAACAGTGGGRRRDLVPRASAAVGRPRPPAPPAPPDNPVFRQCLLDALAGHPECLAREPRPRRPAPPLHEAAVRACSGRGPRRPPPPPPPRDGRCVRAAARPSPSACARTRPRGRPATRASRPRLPRAPRRRPRDSAATAAGTRRQVNDGPPLRLFAIVFTAGPGRCSGSSAVGKLA